MPATSVSSALTLTIDRLKPTLSLQTQNLPVQPSSPAAPADQLLVDGSTEYTLVASDNTGGSGISSTQYWLTNLYASPSGVGTSYGAPFTLALSPGATQLVAATIDVAGNFDSFGLTLVTLPSAPGTPDLIASDDSGAFQSDNVTNVWNLHFDVGGFTAPLPNTGSDRIYLFTAGCTINCYNAYETVSSGTSTQLQLGGIFDGVYQLKAFQRFDVISQLGTYSYLSPASSASAGRRVLRKARPRAGVAARCCCPRRPWARSARSRPR